MYHTRKVRNTYRHLNNQSKKRTGCDFCDPHTHVPVIIEETAHAFVIENRVAYSFWERRRVTQHLMVIPKQHVGHLSDLPTAARHDVMDAIARYEQHGYDVFMRSPKSPT